MDTESDHTAVVEAQHIWKQYGDRVVVKDVSFSVEQGEVLGMVGPNGAGKTTTIRMLLDIIQPDEGKVLLFGRPFTAAHRKLLGYLPEERGLYRNQRVQETLEYLGTLKGMRSSDARLGPAEVLERLDMTEHRDKKIAELSRGMGQLIQLAATIIRRPRLLILDEPFSGLDPLNVRLMRQVLGRLREDGVAIILSTHQMNQVEEFCDKVLMINHGKVLGLGAAGLTQIFVWLVSGFILLTVINTGLNVSIEVPGVELLLVGLLYFVLGYLFSGTLMAGLGAVSSTAQQGSHLSAILVLPMAVPIYLFPYFASNPTAPIVKFLTVFPVTSPVVVMERLAVSSIGFWEITLSLGVVALSVIAAMYIVTRVFRTYLLSYGKSPGLRDVIRTLIRS